MPDDQSPILTAADIAGNSGILPKIAWKGKEYSVAFPCPKSIRELENYAMEEAYKRLDELADDLRTAKGKPWASGIIEVRDQLKKQIINREYAFCEPLYQATFSSRATRGAQLWACLKIAGNKVEATWDDVAEMIREMPERIELLMGVLDRAFFTLAQAKIPGLKLPPELQAKT